MIWLEPADRTKRVAITSAIFASNVRRGRRSSRFDVDPAVPGLPISERSQRITEIDDAREGGTAAVTGLTFYRVGQDHRRDVDGLVFDDSEAEGLCFVEQGRRVLVAVVAVPYGNPDRVVDLYLDSRRVSAFL